VKKYVDPYTGILRGKNGKPHAGAAAKRVPALVLKMQALYDRLNAAEKKVIHYVIDHPEEVVSLSVSDLADKSGSSEATVVRACRSVGMKGYQDLKLSLIQNIVTPLQSIHEEIGETDSASAVLDKIFQSTIHTLKYTRDVIDITAVERAAGLIMQARRIAVFGLGNSHAIALDAQHKFLRLGLDVTAFADSHLQSISSAFLGTGDVVLAISHSGSSRDVIEAASVARENGAKVISISNIGTSPLTKVSDVSLCTASNETKYRVVAVASRHAAMVIIDVIYTLIAMRKGGEAVKGFKRVEVALEDKKY
jgi:DNA-binding MurR/RpiR family transcriptional regulator